MKASGIGEVYQWRNNQMKIILAAKDLKLKGLIKSDNIKSTNPRSQKLSNQIVN